MWDVWEGVDVWLDARDDVEGVDAAFEELDMLDTPFEVEEGVLDVVREAEEDFDDISKFVLVLARP